MGLIKGKICKAGHLMDSGWKHCPVCIAPQRGWWVQVAPDNPDKILAVYPLHQGKMKIGRGADCEIRILHPSLGRHHALLKVESGTCHIADLGAGKPIWVNNREVHTHDLIDGDLVTLGDVEFKVKMI